MAVGDASRADIWREAFALVTEHRKPTRNYFIHRDCQHFNLLWSRERLTGVVDWGGAGLGPPDVDVGHCRLNVTLLFSYTPRNGSASCTKPSQDA